MSPRSTGRSHQVAADAFIARALAIFVIAMAAQSVGAVIAQTPHLARWWTAIVGLSIACSGCWVAVSGLFGSKPRSALSVFALTAVAGLALWPSANAAAESGPPWVWNVLGLAVACVAAAWGHVLALVYTSLTAVILTVVRRLPSGGSASWALSLQDTTFLVTSGLALTAAIQAVQAGAARADASAEAAASAHHASAVARARLIERNRLGAILHDSVLTALVAAARARTSEERAAAAQLAASSLRRIEDYGRSLPVLAVPIAELPDRLRSTVSADALLPVDIYAQLPPGIDAQIPGEAAEALLAAVHAAVDNASRHSGAERIVIRFVFDPAARRLRVEIVDTGRGFDPAAISSRCLGVRLSIIQRMLDAGGSAVIESAPGHGARVLLECEALG